MYHTFILRRAELLALGGWPLPRLWVAGLAGSPVAGSVQVRQRPKSGIRRGLG
jgi:hypothetical protein